ncbi:MAG: tRNA uridine-5-carboxymethylaminomethyl(34) synthesis GTPase MnmE [Pseudomonadota bacterium]
MRDTIFARSTPPGRSGVAIVRLSGPASWDAIHRLTGRTLPPARYMARRNIRYDGELIDQSVVVLFEEGRSFTGEQGAEIQLHGSEAVVRATLAALAQLGGLRPASAGDFTRRALENNRMTLSEVEGLSALLEAETDAQRRLAVGVAGGGLRIMVDRWRQSLVHLLASIEVSVDFADEEVPQAVDAALIGTLRETAANARIEADGVRDAGKIARGFEVAIVGAPNVGKSTLLNRLAGRDAALTSDIAGTTRDIVEVRMEIAGQLVTLLDTAGIREAADTVERLGVDRARTRAEAADLRVFLGQVPVGVEVQCGDLAVRAKADLLSTAEGLAVSGTTGQGISDLLEAIGQELSGRVAQASLAITSRQSAALSAAAEALDRAADMLETDVDSPELAAEDIRSAIQALDVLVGRISPEEVLGEIFAQFCIGK